MSRENKGIFLKMSRLSCLSGMIGVFRPFMPDTCQIEFLSGMENYPSQRSKPLKTPFHAGMPDNEDNIFLQHFINHFGRDIQVDKTLITGIPEGEL